MQPLAAIPSPSRAVWYLGPIPIRAYALCIVAGILVCIWLTLRRWRERGGKDDDIWGVAGWTIVFGIIGGRLYHVISDPELYFKPGKHPLNAFKIWDGGLGIWGAVALGALGAWIGCRRHGLKFAVLADACAPGVLIAQGIGRWGNWFNNELYGGPTSLPWGLRVHCMDIVRGHAVAYGTADGGQVCAGNPVVAGLFHPTFLYESIWDIGMAFLILYLDRRFRMGRGTVAALYFMGYTLGRGWIEALRHDHANHILGLRLNDWTSIAVFLFGLVLFLTRGGFSPQREESPYRSPPGPEASGTEAPATGSTANAGTGKPPEDIRGAPAEDVRAAASTEEVHADVDADASRRPADD